MVQIQNKEWFIEQAYDLSIQSYLKLSEELVAQVPIDLESLKKNWQQLLKVSATANKELNTVKQLAKIAIGRANVLFRLRTRQERIADTKDSRSNTQRNQESIALLEIAWELTKPILLQGNNIQPTLAEQLNYVGVDLDKSQDYKGALDYFLRSLKVRANNSRVSENFQLVLLKEFWNQFLKKDIDTAGRFLLDKINKFGAIDPQKKITAIQVCLHGVEGKEAEGLIYRATTPFFNRYLKKVQAKKWTESTNLMIWCLRIGSEISAVRSEAQLLLIGLNNLSQQGNEECKSCLQRLNKEMPEDIKKEFLEKLLLNYRRRQ